jgi:hypothetical protein
MSAIRSWLDALLAGSLLVAATACYSTPRPECAFLCGEGGSCPDGYGCADDGWCKRDDVPATFDCVGATVDAQIADTAVSIDAETPDATIDSGGGDGDGDGDDD